MKPGPARYLTDQPRTVASALQMLVLVASPKFCARVIAQGLALPATWQVDERLDALIDAPEGSSIERSSLKDRRAVLLTVEALRRIILGDGGNDITPAVREGARLVLEELDYPEPPEGWDEFEGPPEPEPEKKN